MPNNYKDQITYWPKLSVDGYGTIIFGAPQIHDARWEEKNEQFMSPQGDIAITKAVVHIPSYQTGHSPFTVGGYVLLGVSNVVDPTILEFAFIVRQVVRIPDLRYVRNENRLLL